MLCCALCWSQEGPILPWHESRKLTWNDFKAQPDNNERAVAITASGITFGFSIKQSEKQVIGYTTQVIAHFYPEKSWCKKEADAQVLQHEQLHFDITELYARKFRQRISQLILSNTIGSQLKKIHNGINRELAEFQDGYDSQTDFSRNKEQQALWNKEIAHQLAALSEYKLVD